MIISPLRALAGLPSISMLTRSSAMFLPRVFGLCRAPAGARAHQAAAVVYVVLELVAVMLDEALHRPSGGIAEGADGVAFDLLRDVHQHVQVFLPALAVLDALDDPVHPAGAFAARRALAAGFGIVEARDALQHLHHAGGLVHHHHRT